MSLQRFIHSRCSSIWAECDSLSLSLSVAGDGHNLAESAEHHPPSSSNQLRPRFHPKASNQHSSLPRKDSRQDDKEAETFVCDSDNEISFSFCDSVAAIVLRPTCKDQSSSGFEKGNQARKRDFNQSHSSGHPQGNP